MKKSIRQQLRELGVSEGLINYINRHIRFRRIERVCSGRERPECVNMPEGTVCFIYKAEYNGQIDYYSPDKSEAA